jgi:HAMP domain-containing protein
MQYGLELAIPQWLTASLAMLSAASAFVAQFTVTAAEKVRLKLRE